MTTGTVVVTAVVSIDMADDEARVPLEAATAAAMAAAGFGAGATIDGETTVPEAAAAAAAAADWKAVAWRVSSAQ